MNTVFSSTTPRVAPPVPVPVESAALEAALVTAEATDAADALARARARAQKIVTAYYGPADSDTAQKAVTAAAEILEAAGLPLSLSFDPEAEFPSGYGVAIVPMAQRIDGVGDMIVGAWIAAIPDPTTIIASGPVGEAWCRAQILERTISRFRNAVRLTPKGTAPTKAPFSIAEFITKATRDQGLGAFRALAKSYCESISTIMGQPRAMVVDTLRQVLASQAYASQHFPGVASEKWEFVLDAMIQQAKDNIELGDPGILAVWRATRDTTTIELGDLDLAALSEALGLVTDDLEMDEPATA